MTPIAVKWNFLLTLLHIIHAQVYRYVHTPPYKHYLYNVYCTQQKIIQLNVKKNRSTAISEYGHHLFTVK